MGGSPSQGGLHPRGGSPSRGVLYPGGLHPRGAGGSLSGGSPSQGGLHPRGVSIPGGSPSQGGGGFSIQGVLHPRRVSIPGGSPSQGGFSIPGGVPCDLSHHAFDVTCMLPPHQLRHTNSAPAYILLPGHVTCKACWDTHPPP